MSPMGKIRKIYRSKLKKMRQKSNLYENRYQNWEFLGMEIFIYAHKSYKWKQNINFYEKSSENIWRI